VVSVIYFCPKDGTELVPSRIFPKEYWYECPKCGCAIGLPDPKNPNDMGVLLEPWKDFDPHPTMRSGMIRSALEKHGYGKKSRKKRSKPKPPPKRNFPLPIPPPGKKIITS